MSWPALANAQQRPALFFDLPPVGTWVEYDWQRGGKGVREYRGTFRIGVVGEATVGTTPYRWVEIRRETKDGEKTIVQWRKLRVAVNPLKKGDPAIAGVVEGFGWGGPGTAVTKLSSLQIADFLGMGITGTGTALTPAGAKETLKTGLGAFDARRSDLLRKGDKGTLSYYVWLTDAVPFGWAKMELRERDEAAGSDTAFTAAAARRGEKATSEVDETKAQ
jgi:hypothetical protein